MRIELHDLNANKTVFGDALPLPEGMTIEQFLNYDKDIAALIPNIVQVNINGQKVDNWRDYYPQKSDKLTLVIFPRIQASGFLIVTVLIRLISLVTFIVGLFSSPQSPKQRRGARDSDTYSFEGIRDTYTPGGPVPVVYGQHRKGGQVLMYFLEMMPQNKGTQMAMLLSMGEGEVDDIRDIELNDMSVSQIESVSWSIRTGLSSQSIIPGFETIRNTFFDGRPITDLTKNAPKQVLGFWPGCSSLIYRTTAFDTTQAEYFVVAPQGLYRAKSTGGFNRNWSEYAVEFRRSALSSYSIVDAPWTFVELKRISGRHPNVQYWQNGTIFFPRADQYDIQFTWRDARFKRLAGRDQYEIQLQDVTEFRGPSQPFSSEALLAVRAAPTARLHGGQPNVTAIVRGKKVDNYTTTTDFTNEFTQNPAFSIVDYMVNSRYGLGADITISDIDIQSFLDFATLSDSLAEICPSLTVSGCPVYGTANFYEGDPLSVGDNMSAVNNILERFTLYSKHHGSLQTGVSYCRVCCPPEKSWGANSGEYLCSWIDATIYVRTAIDSGNPIFGPVTYVRSGTTQNTATMYGWIFDTRSDQAMLMRWNNQPTNSFGTILLTTSWQVMSGDFLYVVADENYDGTTNTHLNGITSRTGPFADSRDVEIIDTNANRIPPNVLARDPGVCVIESPGAPNYDLVNLWAFIGLCGAGCGAGITQGGSFDFTCTDRIPVNVF